MCHPSKVHLRNFWTWIQMILRIFCSNIKEMFYLFPTEYAAFVDSRLLLIFWGLELSRPLVLLLLATFPSNRRAWDFEQNLWLLFWLVQVFSDWIRNMTYPLRGVITHQFLHAQQVYSVHCKLLSTLLKHWRLLESERESKEPGNIFCSILMVSVFFSNAAWSLI